MPFKVVIAAVVLVFSCAACTGSDDGLFQVIVNNNTSAKVRLEECQALCTSYADSWTLEPGKSASVGQDPSGFQPMQVLTASGAVEGCLPFQFSKTPPKKLVVYV